MRYLNCGYFHDATSRLFHDQYRAPDWVEDLVQNLVQLCAERLRFCLLAPLYSVENACAPRLNPRLLTEGFFTNLYKLLEKLQSLLSRANHALDFRQLGYWLPVRGCNDEAPLL
jgi:hypothetical protein